MAEDKKKPAGSPRWMATFADLSTLLLTFFVIMLSMSTIDLEKFRDLLGSIKDAFGVQTKVTGEYQAASPEELESLKLDPGEGQWQQIKERYQEDAGEQEEEKETEAAREKKAEQEKLDKAVEEIKTAVNRTRLGEQTEITRGLHGIRIRVKGALLFNAGQADLKEEAKPFLDHLVLVLEKFDYFLLVEGHTDSTPIATSKYPSNWELSGARASAVLRYLITWGIPPQRLTSIGLAELYPLASNDTAEGRAENRRVEFVLTKKPFRPAIN